MIRKLICIWLITTINFNVFSQFNHKDFFLLNREMHGVKMITEKSKKWKSISFFDQKGFLVRNINYHKNRKITDYRYAYSISDTLLEIKEIQNMDKIPEKCYIYKYHYNTQRQCCKVEKFLLDDLEKPLGVFDNFIYTDGQLQSYEGYKFTHDSAAFYKYIYIYDDNEQIELFYIYEASAFIKSGKSISVYENGRQTDFIREATDGQVIVSGETLWNRVGNRVHIRYSNFDKHGNWTRSHFITERGKKFRSKERKIEYWQ